MNVETSERSGYELRFQSRFNAEPAYAFPCDEKGRVDLDALGRRAFNDYLYARAVVGYEFLKPSVRRLAAR